MANESETKIVSTTDEVSSDVDQRAKEMEIELIKLRAMQDELEKQMSVDLSVEHLSEIDARSIWIGNVDYKSTVDELKNYFQNCGEIYKATILRNVFTGHPKGCAYIEFANIEAVASAINLNDSVFRGRQIKVSFKRTNKPGISSTDRCPVSESLRIGRGGRQINGEVYYPSYGFTANNGGKDIIGISRGERQKYNAIQNNNSVKNQYIHAVNPRNRENPHASTVYRGKYKRARRGHGFAPY